MNSLLRIALIGFGRISQRHVDAITEIGTRARIVAIVEPDSERRERAKSKGFPTFVTIEDFLQAGIGVDLVSILVPSGSHKNVAEQLLTLKTAILIEKPLALNFRDAKELTERFKLARVPLFVVKQNRLNPPVIELLRRTRHQDFGKLLLINASVLWSRSREYYLQDSWRLGRDSDGGVVWNQASHYIDLLVKIAGTIKSVVAYGSNFLSPAEAEDTVIAIMKSESGALINFQATTTIRPENFDGSVLVSSDKGFIKVGGHALNEIVASTFGQSENTTFQQKETLPSSTHEVYGKSHTGVYLEIMRDLSGQERSQFRAEDGLHVVAVMEALHISIETRREIAVSSVERGDLEFKKL